MDHYDAIELAVWRFILVSSFRESEVKQRWAQLGHAWVTVLLKKLLSNDIWCWHCSIVNQFIYLIIRITVTFHNSECRASLHCTNLTYTSRIVAIYVVSVDFCETSSSKIFWWKLGHAMRKTMFTSRKYGVLEHQKGPRTSKGWSSLEYAGKHQILQQIELCNETCGLKTGRLQIILTSIFFPD